jgi:N-acetylglucosamine-6-phosphate deacetylase
MLIRNGSVLHYDRIELQCDLRVEDGTITALEPGLAPRPGEPTIDASGHTVLAGLIDLHNHGLRHVMAQTDGLLEYSRLLLQEGVTACVPTLGGTPQRNISAMQNGLQETDHFELTPNIIGFRPEITYIAKTGAGSAASLTQITPETTDAIYEGGEGLIKIWDVSPELDDAIPFIRWATEHGIVTSLAHSSATVEQTRRAIEAGLSLVTHFYDTFDLAVQTDAGVYPAGLTDYIQIEDRLTVEIVPDGVHVHPYLVEKTLRCKGLERVVFVTDGVKGAGNPPGIYDGLYKAVQVEVTADRGVRRTSDDALSGSAITQLQAFRNTVQKFSKSVRQASILCSRTPAQVLGLKTKGYLAVGMDADIIILDAHLDLKMTMVGGEVVHQA